MCATQIRITKEKVKGTKAYSALPKFHQILTLKRNNVLHIENAINIINNVGYLKWHQQTNYSKKNVTIIDELVDKEHNN